MAEEDEETKLAREKVQDEEYERAIADADHLIAKLHPERAAQASRTVAQAKSPAKQEEYDCYFIPDGFTYTGNPPSALRTNCKTGKPLNRKAFDDEIAFIEADRRVLARAANERDTRSRQEEPDVGTQLLNLATAAAILQAQQQQQQPSPRRGYSAPSQRSGGSSSSGGNVSMCYTAWRSCNYTCRQYAEQGNTAVCYKNCESDRDNCMSGG